MEHGLRLFLIINCILVLLLSPLSLLAAQPSSIQVINLAPAFAQFWDQTEGQPMAQRVRLFRQQIGSQFSEFYLPARRHQGADENAEYARIAAAIQTFPAIRQPFLDKSARFAGELSRNLQIFQQNFPDFHTRLPIYVLHGLGEMDGGTRQYHDQTYLIFAIDGMLRYHGNNDEAPFFVHELFHVYQQHYLGHCQSAGLWLPLWQEGLAVYVSQVLFPQANYSELLLDIPAGSVQQIQARLPAALSQLESLLDSSDAGLYASLFGFSQDYSGWPARRGYYLGYLIARQLGRSQNLRMLARMDCRQARQAVQSGMQQLRLQYP